MIDKHGSSVIFAHRCTNDDVIETVFIQVTSTCYSCTKSAALEVVSIQLYRLEIRVCLQCKYNISVQNCVT